MAGKTQLIRKVQTAKVADFDDQIWPINVAILILAGFMAGIVLGTSDFEDPRILFNAWTRLAAVGAVTGILFWLVFWLEGRMLRRLRLCIVISLLVNLWVLMFAAREYLALLAERDAEKRSRVIEQYEEITVPDYHWEQLDQPEQQRQTFEEPIKHEAPRPTEPEAIKRASEEPEMPTENEPVEEPEVPQRQQPNPAITQRAELSAPRRADAAAGAQISRQEWKHRPRPNEPIPEPEIRPQPRQAAAAVPQANIAPRRREQARVKVDQRQTFEELSSARAEQLEVRMARRATRQEQLPDRPTTPSPTRQTSRAAEIPRTEAAASEPVQRVVQRAQQVQPKPTMMNARRRADAPKIVRQTAEANPTTTQSRAIAAMATRQQATEQTPQLSRAQRPAPQRRPSRIDVPRETARPQSEAVAEAASAAEVNPANLRVPQRAATPTTPASVRVSQQAATVPTRPAPSAIAQRSVRRITRAAQPLSTAQAARPTRLARAEDVPRLAAAEVAPSAVTAQTSIPSEPILPAALPATNAVSRSTDAPTQVSQSDASARSLPAMTSAAQLPSAMAARRPVAMQQQQPGREPAPARPMTPARSTAGVKLPSNAIASESSPATAAAAPGTIAASSVPQVSRSAAVRQSGSQPSTGGSVSAAGAAEVAIGATQVVARRGQPRTTGVGRPSATSNASTPRIARVTGHPALVASSGPVETAPATPGAVASSADARPSTPALNAHASAARRGGAVRPFASQAEVGSGPVGTSGTSGAVGVALATRMTRNESIASAIAGGGTPKPGRTTGGAISPNAKAEATAMAATADNGGESSEAPVIAAPVSGPRRQVAGQPGSVQTQPMLGAEASLSDAGAAVTSAVARRATASGRNPGQNDIAPARSVTMRRSSTGAELPSIAAVTDVVSQQPGIAGVAALAEGAVPSSLEVGVASTVRRAAADVAVGQSTAASGGSESALGSATAVAMAGRVRATGDDVPAPTASREALRVERSTASPAEIAGGTPARAEPTAEEVAATAAGEAAAAGQLAAGAPSAAVATEAGGVPATLPSEATGALAGPEGGAVAAAQVSRAIPSDTLPAPSASGAVPGPRRAMGALQAAGPSTVAPELAEAGPSTGGVEAGPESVVQASFNAPQRQTSGLPGNLMDQASVETAIESGPAATTPGTAAGERRLPQGTDQGLAMAAEVGRGPLRRTDVAGLPRGVSEAIAEEPLATSMASTPGDAIEAIEGIGIDGPSRQEGGLPVQIIAMAGPGGLGYDPSPEVGLPSRRARPESEIIHTVSRRFVIERSGGELAIDGHVQEEPAKAFRQRDVGRRAQVAQARGGSEGTEKAVEMGLDFFARHQFPDGHWSLHELPPGVTYDDPALGQMKSDPAATGLALLTYLGAGYTHLDDKHRAIVNRGVDWLVSNQQENGDLFSKQGVTKYAWFYSHGICTIALCEAYGMTRDPELREPARKAIDFILKSQHSERGGWRYRPNAESDTSVTGWQLMALKSARMAGLDVPAEAFEKIDGWLDLAENPSGDGRYVYNPYAANTPEQRDGRKPNLAMTAEAMLMRMYLDYESDDPGLTAGADHLKENLPSVGTAAKPARDVYYWYYATQAMFQMQGDYWPAWNDRLRPLAETSQSTSGPTAGSWHPSKPVPDRWGHAGGRFYVTAMHLLMLEVYYRHLPLFQELSR